MSSTYLQLVPSHDLWCEVFCGAAWVTLAKDPATSNLEILNDRWDHLVNFFQVIKEMPEEFLRWGDMEVRSRRKFEDYMLMLRQPVNPRPNPQAAWMFWYLIKSSFTASLSYPRWKYNKVNNPVSRNVHLANVLARWPEIMDVYDRLRDVDIECIDFRDCLQRYDGPKAFFFCDPPYWTPKSGSQDYVHNFSDGDHVDLARILKALKGQFMLTYEDSSIVREAYAWAKIRPVEFNYSVPHDGSAGESKTGQELIITNYDTEQIYGPLFDSLQSVE